MASVQEPLAHPLNIMKFCDSPCSGVLATRAFGHNGVRKRREIMKMKTKSTIMYIALPYVMNEMKYDRHVQVVGDKASRMKYLDALEEEIRITAEEYESTCFEAVRIGGSSPSVMDPDRIGRMLQLTKKLYAVDPRAEVSIKAIPNTVCTPSLTGWAYGNPTRMSLKIDSLKSEELRALGRPWTVQDVQNAILFLDKFHVVNIDAQLMYGIDGQSITSWRQTLRSVLDLEPLHVTVLPMLRSGSVDDGSGNSRDFYDAALDILMQHGFEHYAVGRFAKSDHRDLYHSALLEGADVVGFGLGARSLNDGFAYANTPEYGKYVENGSDPSMAIVDPLALEAEAQLAIHVDRRVRLMDGFDLAVMANDFGCAFPAKLKRGIEAWVARGWIRESGTIIRLTNEGACACNGGESLLRA